MGRRKVRKQALKRAIFFYAWNAFVITALVVLACGKQTVLQNQPDPQISTKPLTLGVFSSVSTPVTDSPLTQLSDTLAALSPAEREELDVRLYVSGADSQAAADAYLQTAGLNIPAVVDTGEFKKYVGQGSFPSVVLLERSGAALSSPLGALDDWSLAVGEAAQILRNRITVILFGAPWCSECKQDLPAIEQEIAKRSPRQRAGLRTMLYVTTATSPAAAPTEAVALEYRNALRLDATAFADPWRWKNFKKYVGGDLVLPGAAVLDPSGNILHSYRAGATNFVPAEIIDFAVRSIP
ncbi:hypothetical protein K2X33_12325 [bacterium]|nr:hypothetical protein [bacterium]